MGCTVTANTCIDLRADTNRDGMVRFDDDDDDDMEASFDETHGAILLANLDDDQSRCAEEATLPELIACSDAADSIVNGEEDLADLAPLRILAWPDAPDAAAARLRIASPGAERVRLFLLRGEDYELFSPPFELTASDLRAGIDLRIEALDFVRDSAAWDGFVDITLEVDDVVTEAGMIPGGQDELRMKVAAVRFSSPLDPSRPPLRFGQRPRLRVVA